MSDIERAIERAEWEVARRVEMAELFVGESRSLLDGDIKLARLTLDALREKQQRESGEGCERCNGTHQLSDLSPHEWLVVDDVMYFYDAQFGYEGVEANLCPNCGRDLRTKERENDTDDYAVQMQAYEDEQRAVLED